MASRGSKQRRRRQKVSADQKANLAQRDVQKSFGKGLDNTAEVIRLMANGLEAIVDVAKDYAALDGVEEHHLEVALGELEQARKRIAIVGKRIDKRGRS